MARKRREEEPENHERWLVSYADFITLLFAFFVVMYAISSVNEGKYKVLSNSLTNAFKNVTGQPGGQPIAVIQGAPLMPVKPIAKPDRLADLKKTEQRQKMKKMLPMTLWRHCSPWLLRARFDCWKPVAA